MVSGLAPSAKAQSPTPVRPPTDAVRAEREWFLSAPAPDGKVRIRLYVERAQGPDLVLTGRVIEAEALAVDVQRSLQRSDRLTRGRACSYQRGTEGYSDSLVVVPVRYVAPAAGAGRLTATCAGDGESSDFQVRLEPTASGANAQEVGAVLSPLAPSFRRVVAQLRAAAGARSAAR